MSKEETKEEFINRIFKEYIQPHARSTCHGARVTLSGYCVKCGKECIQVERIY